VHHLIIDRVSFSNFPVDLKVNQLGFAGVPQFARTGAFVLKEAEMGCKPGIEPDSVGVPKAFSAT